MKTKPTDYIKITARKCGGLQPDVKVGNVYLVTAIESAKSGATVCVCQEGKRLKRINSGRFKWQTITEEAAMRHTIAQVDEARTRKMIGGLTPRERIQLTVVPLVYIGLAWEYALAVLAKSAEERVSELKKACRAVRALHADYQRIYRGSLGWHEQELIERQAKQFKEAHAYNFAILYWSLNGYFKKLYPTNDHQEMRTNAIISMLFVRLAYAHSTKWGNEAERRTGVRQYSKLDSEGNRLYVMMEAFAGIDNAFDFGSPAVMDNAKVIINKMESTEMELEVMV